MRKSHIYPKENGSEFCLLYNIRERESKTVYFSV